MKNRIITILFCSIICAVLFANVLTPDKALSYSERRKLTQKPSFDKGFFLGGEAENLMEKYLLDQFAGRDSLRALKAVIDLKLFNKKDNNGIYVIEDNIFKTIYPMDKNSVAGMADKISAIYDMYLEDCNVAFGIIPSKDTYISEDEGYLRMDYDEMLQVFADGLTGAGAEKNISILDLKPVLRLESYYSTDLHWRQEELGGVTELLGNHFGFVPTRLSDYETKRFEPFYGAYYGQAALKLPPDSIIYLVNNVTENSVVTNFDEAAQGSQLIYDESKLGSIDSYEVYLSGNSPLVTLENPMNSSGKELIVFRDSFGSSLAPLLLENYSKITLIDLRFVPYANLGHFVNFDRQDVLFLYGMEVMNSSNMIK